MNASREADIIGKVGKAWDITEAASAPTNATVGAWVVEYTGPDGNTMHYYVGLAHLRMVPGQPKPEKFYSNAAFEFVILLVDPNHEPDIDRVDAGDVSGVAVIIEPTVLHQFNGPDINDKKAAEIIKDAIALLLSPPKHPKDRLSPEKDYNENWIKTIQAGIDSRIRRVPFKMDDKRQGEI